MLSCPGGPLRERELAGVLLGEEDGGILGSGLGEVVVGMERLSRAALAPIEVGVGCDGGTACSGSQSK